MSRLTARARDEKGAALVEFAIAALLLFTLLFGIIEFGWAFSQNLDVRHGAREASRLVAVNYQPDPAHTGQQQAEDIAAEVCDRMDGGAGSSVTLRLPTQLGSPAGASGQRAEIEVERDLDTLTGFFDSLLSSVELTSEVDTRIEVDATWASAFNTEWKVDC